MQGRSSSLCPSNGFILLSTLLMLSLTVGALLLWVQLLTRSAACDLRASLAEQARQAALYGMQEALAALQFHAGPDAVSTLDAELWYGLDGITGQACPNGDWLMVQGDNSVSRRWLVSSASHPADPMRELPAQSSVIMGVSVRGREVRVEKVALPLLRGGMGVALQGFYAYWVRDLQQSVDPGAFDALPPSGDEGLDRLQRLCHAPGDAIKRFLPRTVAAELGGVPRSRVVNPGQLDLISGPELHPDPLWQSAIGLHSYGVPASADGSGLKRNLCNPGAWAESGCLMAAAFVRPEFYLGQGADAVRPDVYQVVGNRPEGRFDLSMPPWGSPHRVVAPALSEFRLSCGLFHTQSDRRHRLRFHLYSEWVNPYPYAMAYRYPKGLVAIVDGLPTLEVTNLASMESFRADLNDFDENLYDNSLNESKLHAWLQFAPLEKSGGALRYGLEAGRVYGMVEPRVEQKPDGLARTLAQGEHAWRYNPGNAPATGRLPGTLYADDRVRIRSIAGSAQTMNLSFVPVNDALYAQNPDMPMPEDQHPDAFVRQEGLVLRLEGVAFDPIDFELSAQQYSRARSGDFSPNDYRLAFHFRLDEDGGGLDRFAEWSSWRSPFVDLRKPGFEGIYAVDRNPRAAAAEAANQFSGLDYFHDEQWNSNRSQGAIQVLGADHPIGGTPGFQHLMQLSWFGMPDPWLGSARAGELNRVFDRFLFFDALSEGPWGAGDHGISRWRVLRNGDGSLPDRDALSAVNASASLLLRGAFNVHSSSVEAWAALLKREVEPAHMALAPESHTDDAASLSNFFCRHPFGQCYSRAPVPEFGGEAQPAPGSLDWFGRGMRLLQTPEGKEGDAALMELAGQLTLANADELRNRGAAFRSVADYVNSGVMDRAIAASGINRGIAPLSSAYLRQSDLMASIGPLLQVRGDSFVIRTMGEVSVAKGKAAPVRARLEVRVQRLPGYFDADVNATDAGPETLSPANRRFGRRFRVLSQRWLAPHEP
jgi:hypothetical protein